MTCPSCGATNESGAGFCYRCGAPLKSPNPAATGPTVNLNRGQRPEAQSARGFTSPSDDPHARVYEAPHPSNKGWDAYNIPAPSLPQYTPPGQYPTQLQSYGLMSLVAILSLILAMASFVGPFIMTSIPALVLGYVARKQLRASQGQLAGDGIAQIAILVAWTNIVVSIVGFCLLYTVLQIGVFEFLGQLLNL